MAQASTRLTAPNDGDVVVFLIGVRIHKWWAIHRWLPVARAMGRMRRELEARPESGFLGAIDAGPGLSVQYWRSLEQLLAYAHDREGEHFPAWADFNRRLRRSRAVGIWHETYSVASGAYESMYIDMPPTGLGAFVGAVDASGARRTARGRLGQHGAATAAA